MPSSERVKLHQTPCCCSTTVPSNLISERLRDDLRVVVSLVCVELAHVEVDRSVGLVTEAGVDDLLALGYPALLFKESRLRDVVEILAELEGGEEVPFPVKDATRHAVRERRRRRPAQVRFAPCSPSNLRFEASNQGCLFTSSPPRPPPPRLRVRVRGRAWYFLKFRTRDSRFTEKISKEPDLRIRNWFSSGISTLLSGTMSWLSRNHTFC